MMGFVEATGVAEGVDYTADIERVGTVTTEAEAVEEAESFVYVSVYGAEIVNRFGPERPVVDAHLF